MADRNESLEELRETYKEDLELLKGELKECVDASKVPHDTWLLRFLVRSNANKALPRVLSMLKWRRENGVDEIGAEIQRKHMQPKDFPHFEEVTKAFPQTIWCDDTIHGMPYGLDKYGSINIKKLLSSVTPDELYTFNLYKLEYMRIVLDDISARTGRLARWTQVACLKGLSLSHLNKTFIPALKRVSKDAQDHYREMIGTVICINCSSTFTIVWKIVSAVLHERTKEKVSIKGTSFLSHLSRSILPDRLPRDYGGLLEPDHTTAFSYLVTAAPSPMPQPRPRSRSPQGYPTHWRGSVFSLEEALSEAGMELRPKDATPSSPEHLPVTSARDVDVESTAKSPESPEARVESDAEPEEILLRTRSGLSNHVEEGPEESDDVLTRARTRSSGRFDEEMLYSDDAAINAQLSRSNQIYSVQRSRVTTGDGQSQIRVSMSGGDTITSTGTSYQGDAENEGVMQKERASKFHHYDWFFLLWSLVLVACILNYGAIDGQISMERIIGWRLSPPLAVDLTLWVIILVVPLLVWRDVRSEIMAPTHTSQVDTASHEMLARLYMDLNGLHTKLARSAMTSERATAWGVSMAAEDCNARTDELVQRAVHLDDGFKDAGKKGGSDHREGQVRPRLSTSTMIKSVRHEMSRIISTAASLQRNINSRWADEASGVNDRPQDDPLGVL